MDVEAADIQCRISQLRNDIQDLLDLQSENLDSQDQIKEQLREKQYTLSHTKKELCILNIRRYTFHRSQEKPGSKRYEKFDHLLRQTMERQQLLLNRKPYD
jgi:GrpB-like predicted nucleotidyltransferase (UPF0157 family)